VQPRRIRFSHTMGDWPLARQTPGGRGVWGDCIFLSPDAPGADEPDYWLVYEELGAAEEARVAPGRVVFVTGEPEAKRYYAPEFLAQFGLVVTSQARIQGANVVHTQPALPWHVGVRRHTRGRGDPLGRDFATLGYDELRTADPDKPRELSLVCSAKRDVEGQRRRLAFAERLQEHFGARLDWFGRGTRPIEDKWDAVAPYRFHVVLENTVEADYWSEKLADAYLGLAFPLYWGCANLEDYFDADSFVALDLERPEDAIAAIERALAEGVTPVRAAAVARARDAVLDRYNLFPAIAGLLDECPDGPPHRVKLRPAASFVPGAPLWRRAASPVARALRSQRRG
jgi:hypothetical protein